jgi:hypothetical protein
MKVQHRNGLTQDGVVLYLNEVCRVESIWKQGYAYICLSLYVLLVTRLHTGLSHTSKRYKESVTRKYQLFGLWFIVCRYISVLGTLAAL